MESPTAAQASCFPAAVSYEGQLMFALKQYAAAQDVRQAGLAPLPHLVQAQGETHGRSPVPNLPVVFSGLTRTGDFL